MDKNFENGEDKLSAETKDKLKSLSKALLRLHKTLLEAEKLKYEAKNGKIPNPNVYLSLVIDDPHFAWLRKISALIALIDEAVSVRRPATETEARALFDETKILLDFKDADEAFNNKFQNALQNNPDAVLGYNDALEYAKK